MKKFRLLTLVLLAALVGTTAKAQIQKGNIMVGASVSNFQLDFQKDNTKFSMDLTPKVGWFIRDGLAIGGYAQLGLTTAKASGTQTTYGVGAFGRYFVEDKNVRKLEFSKRVRFFLEANAGFGGSSNSSTSTSTTGLDLGVGPGIAYFITPNVSLEGLLKYNLTVGFGSSTTNNRLNLGVGFQIYLPSAKAKQIYKDETRGK
ncbi:outer membrane beta-barrel protein [Chitinophaga nivalis]|uniref:Outer membrane beta-barrel protein n=1 Tax=Chitinophaga nivalis TaxID=2991709 RepID=A0ABT3IEX7_9BACT|nr:outer membrane beta-barrel protein [Chitinophaga nivalis]MCW3467796.1 outer membrane beta-barrel protein [Chitinophaga nivalis]MCW3482512.1 outer membrane beta-barrel protein [Chitinophaga nivalis]